MSSSGSPLQLALDDPRWVAFVTSAPDALPFHHPAWALLLSECYGYRAFGFALPGADGEIEAGIPVLEVTTLRRRRRWISLPFTDYCPPMCGGRTRREIVDELDAVRREDGVSELEVRAPLEPIRAPRPHFFMHTLRLEQDPGAVFAKFASSVKRNVRSAENRGITVREAALVGDVPDTFYGLQVETRRRLGIPTQPRRYYELLASRILERGLGFALLAEADGVAVAGAIFLQWNGRVTYKYGASNPEFWRLRPNNLIFWRAIERSCAAGCRTFDFGRTARDDDGLRRFKQGWGTDEEPLAYTTTAPSSNPPASVAAGLMRPVIRRSPPWVSRVLGELLYKYAA